MDIFSKGFFALGLAFVAESLDFKRLGLWMYDHGRIAPGYGDEGLGTHDKVRPGTATGAVRDSGVAYDTYGAGPATAEGAGPTTTTTATA